MVKVYGTDRRSLKGAARKSALKADATRYLRRILSAEQQGFRLGM